MLQSDIQKELESLKKQISDLEEKVSDKKSNIMFGRSYSQIGSSDSDFIIKTKGQVKIQWGNKFIDLIKDGKINVDSKFIFTVNTVDDIGIKNGIYVTKDGSVYLKIGDSVINLVGEIGTSYVSFMEPQQTTSDQKLMALKNIGFLYDSISNVDSSSIQNGVIYVLSEQKLYTVKDGVLSEFSIEFPNPFTEQFIIQKNDSSQGALLIKGSGINNSLAFESLYIYSDSGKSYLQSEGTVVFNIDAETVLELTKDNANFKVNVNSNMFQSIGADNTSGFRLYIDSNGSTLEVDNLVVRNYKEEVDTVIFPSYWSLENNIITKAEQVQESLGSGYALTLKYQNQYKIGDRLYVYGDVIVDDFRDKLVKIPIEVGMIDTETSNTIYVQVINGVSSEADSLTELPDLVGKVTFLISTDSEVVQLRYQEQNLDLLQYTQFDEEPKKESVKHRIGSVDPLELKGKENGEEVPIEGLGTYTEVAAFLKAQYISKYELPITDNSTKFASTEWINKLFPKGTIMMFSGSAASIPECWAICDGTNGTPNLIDKFVKGGSSSGATGGELEVTLTKENLPAHTHTVQSGAVTTSSAGLHRHSIGYTNGDLGDNANNRNNILGSSTTYTGYDGQHTHTVDLSKITLSTEGEGKPIKIEPPYYTLIYIMKIV